MPKVVFVLLLLWWGSVVVVVDDVDDDDNDDNGDDEQEELARKRQLPVPPMPRKGGVLARSEDNVSGGSLSLLVISMEIAMMTKEKLCTYSTGLFTGPIPSHLCVITSTFPLNTLLNNSYFFFSVTLRGPPKTKLSHITFR